MIRCVRATWSPAGSTNILLKQALSAWLHPSSSHYASRLLDCQIEDFYQLGASNDATHNPTAGRQFTSFQIHPHAETADSEGRWHRHIYQHQTERSRPRLVPSCRVPAVEAKKLEVAYAEFLQREGKQDPRNKH